MAGYTSGQDFGSEVLSTISKSQAAVVEAIGTWATALQPMKPELPAVSVPFADKLPAPHEVMSGAYDFAEKLLATQRKFAEGVLAATEPLLGTAAAPGAKQQQKKKAAA